MTMVDEPIDGPTRGTEFLEESLAGMMTRLDILLTEHDFDDDAFVEMMAIYNNVAYVFLYLEAIDDDAGFDELLPWRARFYDDAELRDRMTARLDSTVCNDPRLDRIRVEYLAQLRTPAETADAGDARIEQALHAAREVLGRTDEAHRAVLERLGAPVGDGNPEAVFYRVLQGLPSPATRAKLTTVWTDRRDAGLQDLLTAVDSMVEVRRARSAEQGRPSVAADTLRRSSVDEDQVVAFLDAYLDRAVPAQEDLEAEIRSLVGDVDHPLRQLGYAMHRAFDGEPVPQFSLDGCLDYAFAVAQGVFGVTVRRVASDHPNVVTAEVVRPDGEQVGRILFDLWDLGRSAAANRTYGLRNRVDWAGLVQRPVAYVSCRFHRGADDVGLVTFQDVHSILHEFGHALNHLLMRTSVPFRSGLESLPPERVECLSMWFEKWAYHASLVDHVEMFGGREDPVHDVDRCIRIKMLEHRSTALQRGVTAWLDLDVHRRADGGLAASFERLDARRGISRFLVLGDVATSFTWPMYVANPGANFSYLWGAADSAAKFEPFRALTLSDVAARPSLREPLAGCFDVDVDVTVPETAAIFDLYAPARFDALDRA